MNFTVHLDVRHVCIYVVFNWDVHKPPSFVYWVFLDQLTTLLFIFCTTKKIKMIRSLFFLSMEVSTTCFFQILSRQVLLNIMQLFSLIVSTNSNLNTAWWFLNVISLIFLGFLQCLHRLLHSTTLSYRSPGTHSSVSDTEESHVLSFCTFSRHNCCTLHPKTKGKKKKKLKQQQ